MVGGFLSAYTGPQGRGVVEEPDVYALVTELACGSDHRLQAVAGEADAFHFVGPGGSPVDGQGDVDPGLLHRGELRGVPFLAFVADLFRFGQVVEVPLGPGGSGLVEVLVGPPGTSRSSGLRRRAFPPRCPASRRRERGPPRAARRSLDQGQDYTAKRFSAAWLDSLGEAVLWRPATAAVKSNVAR